MFPSLKGMVLIELNTNGIMYLGFTDIRDAEEALKKATKLRPEWVTQYFPPNQFALKTDPGSTSPVSVYEGQVMVRAHYGGQSQRFNAGATQQLVKELLDNYGDIKVFRKIQTAESPVVEFHAEFYDTTAANVAVASVNGFKIGVCNTLRISITVHIVQADRNQRAARSLSLTMSLMSCVSHLVSCQLKVLHLPDVLARTWIPLSHS